MFLGICGNWGGNDTRIRLYVEENICVATFDRQDWIAKSNRFPINMFVGEGTDVWVQVLRASTNLNLTITVRDIKLGRRGG